MSFVKHCLLIMSRAFNKKPLLYLLIIISQIVSVLCIFFAFGLILNAYTSFENDEISERYFSLEFTDRYNESLTDTQQHYSGSVTYEEFYEKFKEIREILGDNLEEVLVRSKLELDGKAYDVASFYYDPGYGHNNYDIAINPKSLSGYNIGDTLVIGGKKYNIVKTGKASTISFLNYEDTPSEAMVYEFYFVTKEPLVYDVYKEVENKIQELYDYFNFDKPETPRLLDIQMNNTQITMSAVLIVIVVLNCSLCYMFLYESRKKIFAIYRICGAREEYCMLICITEVIVYMVISFATAFLIFDKLLENIVIDFYPKAVFAYTTEN